MEDCVERLIEELRAACRRHDATLVAPETSTPGEGFVTLAESMNVAPHKFPAAAALSQEQAARLTQAILDLWHSFDVEAVYPEGFPPHLLYPLLVAKFADFRVAIAKNATTKTVYVGFCDYNPAHCPFGRKYCQICWDDCAEQEMLQA